ncbi:anthranilate phosphoribosyltransferase [Bacillus cereus]|uniref:anthranilate phosphoribosyltransferase n=1 Tax=Bacillus TaxID=1386 RepID=UPI00068AD3D6|nr:anthranilate phosphoribosyltransferase [Bacillus sp. UNC322MFChir4.1]
MCDYNSILIKLINKNDLSKEEAYFCMKEILSKSLSRDKIITLLTALKAKGETTEEIMGFANYIMDEVVPFEVKQDVIDTCGTGGDHSGSFNASTMAALIASSADVFVAKSGNRASTSKCGSADLLEAIGISIDLTPSKSQELLEKTNFAFLFTQLYHPRLRRIANIRSSIGFKTVFNLLGPLCSPSRPTSQLVGVSKKSLLPLYADLLMKVGRRRALIVHGMDGLDEMSISSPTVIYEVHNSEIKNFTVTPEELGLRRYSLLDIKGDGVKRNIEIFNDIINNKPSPIKDFCVINAAAALYIGDRVESLKEGVNLAQKNLHNGKVKEKFEKIKEQNKLLAGGRLL